MAYAVQSDITDRYGADFLVEIADRDDDGTIDGEDVTAVTKALDDASATIDSYITLKYDDPQSLDPEPPAFKRWCVDIASFYLASSGRDSLTDTIERRHDHAIGELQMVAKGEMGLGVADPPATVGASVVMSSRAIERGMADTEGLI